MCSISILRLITCHGKPSGSLEIKRLKLLAPNPSSWLHDEKEKNKSRRTKKTRNLDMYEVFLWQQIIAKDMVQNTSLTNLNKRITTDMDDIWWEEHSVEIQINSSTSPPDPIKISCGSRCLEGEFTHLWAKCQFLLGKWTQIDGERETDREKERNLGGATCSRQPKSGHNEQSDSFCGKTITWRSFL